ncbi:hypothetical protein GCM10010174_42370 [Kutzneria viridogrisea]|uniref:LigA protein n=1 Tax=Kutzneria viridogrisea TaxID=47990 RepID=A0ABR6BVI9_9PSEU|nr:hypothetical protein [Kutzneria viridogrisea]
MTPGDTDNAVHAAVGGDVYQFRDVSVVTHNYARRGLPVSTVLDAGRAASRFVRPGGFGVALARLAGDRVVVLASRRGTGRRTAATCLLDGVGGLSLAEIEVDEESPLAKHPVSPRHGYLLDLTTADDRTVEQTATGLAAFRAKLSAEGSWLVLVVPPAHGHLFEAELVDLRPPAADEVLLAHLAADGLDDQADKWLAEPEVRRLLAGARVSDAARMADLVRRVSAQDGDFAQCCADVVAALRDWSDQLTAEFRAHPDVPWRALLLAAAVLDQAHPDSVLAASEALLRATGYVAEEEVHPLAGEGLAARLASVGAVVDNDRVRLPKPDYARSVLGYAWRDFPALRDHLVRWMISLPERYGDGEVVAGHLMDLAVPSVLTTAVAAWAERTPLRRLAERLLVAGALDTGLGFAVRRTIYDWSCRRDLSTPLSTVALAVCGGELGQRYPQVALTRIGHFAAREELAQPVLDALSSLAHKHFTQVVIRLRRWLGEGPAPWDLVVTALLDAAESEQDGRGWILDQLVAACSGRPQDLGALELAALRWRGAGGADRQRVQELLLAKVNRADPLVRAAISS